MSDDFLRDLRDDDEESPDWIQDIGGDDEGEVDEFEQLRRRSARVGAASETMVVDEDFTIDRSSTGGAFLNSFTPGQRLVLAILVLLNIIVIGLGLLAMTGRIGL